MKRACLILGFAAGIVLISRPASDAQYIANSQTNIISGVTSNWAGDYMVGSNTFANVLIVRNNATLNDAGGYLGYSAGSYKNAAIVTAPGSAWNNDTLFVGYSGSNNTLTVTNSGTEYDANAYIGYTNGANNNAILVTGTGSTWYNSGGDTIYDAIYLGYSGSGNTLTVTNGGTVYSGYSYIGEYAGASNNAVIVTGNGSVWYNDEDDNGELHVGDYGSRNTLTITNGGAVINVEGYIGELAGGNSNAVTVTGAGSVWSNSSWLLVGTRGSGNTLSITNGGAVYSFGSLIGGLASGGNNAGAVTGAGSVWTNNNGRINGFLVGYSSSGNTLTITNGGALVNLGNGYIGGYVGGGDTNLGSVLGANTNAANNNAVIVTGAGSVWNNSTNLTVGYYGSGNTLTIANSGTVYNANAYIGYTNGANNNAVTVTGLGSLWDSGGNLVVGVFGSTNSLTVATNGSVLASNACVGLYPASAGNQVAITGGGLCVTNAPGTGVLNVLRGALTLNSGTATANRLVITNGANGLFTFNGGTLTSGGTFVTNSQVFAVGDGTDAATFQLAGGVHSFANNLEIRNNATLTGCGTIQGNFTIDPGGTVVANCGGALTFSGVVTNNGTMQAIDGSTLEAYGSVVNNGTIDVINGSTNFHGAFVNHGTVLTAGSVKISQVSRSGQSFVVQIPSATGHSYQLQYTTSLVPANWIDTGTSQAGTGGILTFTDSGATTNAQRFYRIDLTAP
jgi:T5SS/PEP-CTERM-associated repeat protein